MRTFTLTALLLAAVRLCDAPLRLGRLATNIKYMQEQVRKAQKMQERKSAEGDGDRDRGDGSGEKASAGEKGETGEKAATGGGDSDGVTALGPITERGESKLSDGFGMSAEDLMVPGSVAKAAHAVTGGLAPAAAAQLPPPSAGGGSGGSGVGGDGGGNCISHLQSRVKLQTGSDADGEPKQPPAAAAEAAAEEAFEEMSTGVGSSLWGRARKKVAPKTEKKRGSTESIPEILKVVSLAREMQARLALEKAGAAAVGAAAAAALAGGGGGGGGGGAGGAGGAGGGGGDAGDPLLLSGVQRLVGDVAELRLQQRADTARLEARLGAVQTQLEQAVKLMAEMRTDGARQTTATLGASGAADG